MSQGKPSSTLLTAALTGLLGANLAGCGKDDSNTSTKPVITSTTVSSEMNFTKFSEDCKTRAGIVQTHAACSGANSCKGMSFNMHSKKLIEHTCKGANTCHGMSCVDTPADKKTDGATNYNAMCGGMCHGGEANKFVVFYPKGGNADAAIATYKARSNEALLTLIAFGTKGVNTSGSAYSNMPDFYDSLSRGEMERIIEHMKTLTPTAQEYEIAGQ